MMPRSGKVRAALGFTALMGLIFIASVILRAQIAVNIATVAATFISAVTFYYFFTAEPTDEKLDGAMLELGLALEKNWGYRMALLLGRDTELPAASRSRPANLTFSRITELELMDEPSLALDGNWNTIHKEFYQHISSRRLVIVGDPGYGKTLLAIQLVLQILQARNRADSPDKKLPVPVSVAGWDGARISRPGWRNA